VLFGNINSTVDGSSRLSLGARANDGNMGPVEALVIQNNGFVGIGTTSPSFLLHVNGSAGKPGGGSWAVASDRRLKKNVQDLDHPLDRLLRLRGVTFEYKDPAAVNELPGIQTGMVAQEVE